jgi:riboflavin kinase
MIKPNLLQALKTLALEGANKEFIEITTSELGKLLGISQQSASRRLREMLEEELIEERRFGKKIWIRITKKGIDLLKKEALEYRRIFEVTEGIEITGEVISGLGEGKYYIMKEGYYNQIKEKLFFEPYPGTLNIRVYAKDIEKVELLKNLPGICIKGFVSEGRTFGNVKAFLCIINGKDAALIMPERSHYKDVVEIIADKNLREELNLKDGSIVDIVVFP